jgi:DNA (cytosine-5)-methyltransferase 1
MGLNYLSVCSGIEAASVAFEPLGWNSVGFSEIDTFPSRVLEYRFPSVPNLGDMSNYKEWTIDGPEIIIGGTPCQSYSKAGRYLGEEDERGKLLFVYADLLAFFRPQYFIFENVPGLLSSGDSFYRFISQVTGCGYSCTWRVLDSQYFGLPQRRRRVYVVGLLGTAPERTFSLLHNAEGGSWNLPQSYKTKDAYPPSSGTKPCVSNGEGVKGLPSLTASNLSKGVNNQTPLIYPEGSDRRYVRRLTPEEAETLQGFPAGWTEVYSYTCCNRDFHYGLGKYGCPICNGDNTARLVRPSDTARYHAIGNAMSVNVVRAIGYRIQQDYWKGEWIYEK